MKPLLTVENLSVSFPTYQGVVQAVRDISFSLAHAETVAVVGESGCGKSATAQAIMGLIPQKNVQGKIVFDGMRGIAGKEIGMIFQDPMTSLNPTMHIGQQITEGLIKHRGFSKKKAYEEAIEILKLVGISDPSRRVDQYPHEFSGGMRQRVIIAIALACRPKLLIADEPTTALDVTIQAQILDLMKELQQKMEMSIILITHDLGIVAGMCNRVLVMYGGQIVERGGVEEIYKNPSHPYTQGLLRSIPRLDMPHDQELVPIYGTPPNLIHPPSGCPFTARCEKAMRVCPITPPPLVPITPHHEVACWLKTFS